MIPCVLPDVVIHTELARMILYPMSWQRIAGMESCQLSVMDKYLTFMEDSANLLLVGPNTCAAALNVLVAT